MSLAQNLKKVNISDRQQQSENDSVYKEAVKYLNVSNTEFKCEKFKDYVIELIQNDKYSVALKLLNVLDRTTGKSGILPSNYLILERLYVFYKLNDNEMFAKYSNKLKINEVQDSFSRRALLHLQAQQFYKLGYYNNAIEIYKVLSNDENLKNFDDVDFLINEKAIGSQQKLFTTEIATKDTEMMNGDESYDYLFNEALIELNEQNFVKSLSLCKDAKDKVFQYYSKEGQSESVIDLFLDSAPMFIQMSFINQHLGNNEVAVQILDDFYEKFHVIINGDSYSSDSNVTFLKLLYLNNYMTLNKDKIDPLSMITKFKFGNLIAQSDKDNRFLKFQYFLLKRNEAVFNFIIGKKISITPTLNYTTSTENLRLPFDVKVLDDNHNYDLTILALACLQDFKGKNGDDVTFDSIITAKKIATPFKNYVEAGIALVETSGELFTKKIIAGSLLAIQMLLDVANETNLKTYLNEGRVLLQKLVKNSKIKQILLSEYFGVITFLLNICELCNTKELYKTTFYEVYEEVYKFYISKQIKTKFEFNFLKRLNFESLNMEVDGEQTKKVVELFEKLLEFQPNDKLIPIMMSKINKPNEPIDVDKLLSVEELTSGLEFDSLVNENLQKLLDNDSTKSTKSTSIAVKNKRVRKKPQHINKGALEGKPIDMERWLPMRDRTYYKVSKKDKKKKKKANSVQGGLADNVTEESGIVGKKGNRK